MRSSKARRETTEVIESDRRILETILALFNRAKTRVDLSVSYVGPRTGEEVVSAIRAARARGVMVRMVTEVTKDNLRVMLAASKFMETRHIAGLRGNSWAVTEGEYISSLAAGEFDVAIPIIYSNAGSLVAEHRSIFDALWERGEPLGERAGAIRTGTELPEMEIVRDAGRARELYLSLAKRAKNEVLLIFPTPSAFRRDDGIGVIRVLEERASKGVKVKVLVPVDPQVSSRLASVPPGKGMSYKGVLEAQAQETVTVLVVDGSASLTIDERDPSSERFEEAFGSAILSTREPRVRQNSRMFDRIWKEAELAQLERSAREKEESSRKRAELMQDILTHDIRNFNQVAMLNAELLHESMTPREGSERIAAILRAIDGSTKLIERAKRLGNIMAVDSVELRPMSLREALARSVQLVKKGNPSVRLKLKGKLTGQVLADGLLGEVFVNIITNAVKYTDGNDVTVTVGQRPDALSENSVVRPCWRIWISDRGRGIPDGQKEGAFRRYLETAMGSGLGLSIVHALVAERYRGRVALKDRVENDYTQGTTVEIWLPRPR